jgi:acyl-CoA reductase-like NAD-dependent aldehyde dehydrogenase
MPDQYTRQPKGIQMTSYDGARLFIGGRFRSAHEVEPVVEAATERHLGDGASAAERDIDDAITAAREALPGWRSTPTTQRAELVNRLADALQSRAAATSELVSRENGTPIASSGTANGAMPVAFIRYYARDRAHAVQAVDEWLHR